MRNYPFKVGIVTSVSCRQLLRSINSEGCEDGMLLTGDLASIMLSIEDKKLLLLDMASAMLSVP